MLGRVDSAAEGARKRPWALAVGLVLASLVLAPVAVAKPAPKPLPYTVEVDFIQTREWTYYHQQVGPECTGTDEGNGSDRATLKAKGLFNLQSARRGFAGLGAKGIHSRVGTMTHTTGTPNYPGASCGGPATTTTEPVTGCGPTQTKAIFATLDLIGKKLLLQWESSASVPDFDCPYFDGSNEATSANALPGATYRDVIATGVDRKELLAATKRQPAVATGNSQISRFESCANLVEPCSEGVSYDASATVKSFVKLYFTPKKR
jgi:hypothetical protein